MTNRKAGYYWVRYTERLVSLGATKEWVPLYWQGERFEDEHYFLEHRNIREVGPRIPTPDEPTDDRAESWATTKHYIHPDNI